MRLGLLLLNIVSLSLIIALSASRPILCRGATVGRSGLAAGPMSAKAKVKSRKWSCRGRARFTCKKCSEGAVKNPCYFAMDATRPNDLGDGKLGRRFYVICEADRSFRAISAGHGGGRDLKGIADFANGRQCAKNFGNAMDSKLTAGGAYVTGETKTSFKGYYRVSAKRRCGFGALVHPV